MIIISESKNAGYVICLPLHTFYLCGIGANVKIDITDCIILKIGLRLRVLWIKVLSNGGAGFWRFVGCDC